MMKKQEEGMGSNSQFEGLVGGMWRFGRILEVTALFFLLSWGILAALVGEISPIQAKLKIAEGMGASGILRKSACRNRNQEQRK